MRQLVIAWFVVVALGFVLAGSCAIDHRSGAFECEKQSDCDPPRTCSDGLCVKPGGTTDASTGDARTDAQPIDAFACPDQCTSCDQGRKECTIDCMGDADCNNQVVCPEGWNCIIKCSTTDSCRNGINCQGSESCIVQCTGVRSCRNLTCGNGPCNVNCSASESCRNIFCGQSCACDVKCGLGSACIGVSCTAPQCDTGFGCSSTQFPGCESCP